MPFCFDDEVEKFNIVELLDHQKVNLYFQKQHQRGKQNIVTEKTVSLVEAVGAIALQRTITLSSVKVETSGTEAVSCAKATLSISS